MWEKIFCIVTILCCCKIYIILSDVSDPWSQSGHLSMVHGERGILIIWYFRPFTLELCSTQNNSLYEKCWGRLTLLWGLYNLESSLNIVPFHLKWNGRLLHMDSTYECLKGIAVRIGDSKRVLPIHLPSLYPLLTGWKCLWALNTTLFPRAQVLNSFHGGLFVFTSSLYLIEEFRSPGCLF